MSNGKKKVLCEEGSGSSSNGETAQHCHNHTIRIMLCETDVKTCRQIFAFLGQCSNYQVIPVYCESTVMNALNSWGPQMDIILAEAPLLMSGGARILKYITHNKDLKHIPVIMMLGEDDVSLIVKGLKLGARDYIMKPFSVAEVLNLWTHVAK